MKSPSMTPMRERSINIVIANISTNITLQVVLTLILFSQVTYSWNLFCLGAPIYTLSFENRLPDEIKIECVGNFFTKIISYEKNPDLNVKFCGAWGIFDPRWLCNVVMKNPRCVKKFIAFYPKLVCATYKERHCHWQIHRETVSLYNPENNSYKNYRYEDSTCSNN